MAKDDASPTEKDGEHETGFNMDAVPEALRYAGRRAAELAQNPVARSLLAAGLVAVAAGLATNKNVRETTRRNVREAQRATADAFDVAGDNANKMGAAIVNAVSDAVHKMVSAGAELVSSGDGDKGSTARSNTPAPTPAPARRKAEGAKATPARKPRAAKAAGGEPKAKAAPRSRKPATAKSDAAKPASRRKSPNSGDKAGS